MAASRIFSVMSEIFSTPSSLNFDKNAPQKASPQPVASTAGTFRPFTLTLPSLKNAFAPFEPKVSTITEILNSFIRPFDDRKLSNALCENINGKLNTYLNISRGIINFKRFRKRAIYALNPKVFYSLTHVLKADAGIGYKRGKYKKIKE